ncbi:glutamate synthase subunit beta [SAR202 cluster bacterium AC-647-N09_OGT_505m]|nr:glutamate synthase subunit beta [SAR202 cluster bacterium AC-647-N09_OGT_505m]
MGKPTGFLEFPRQPPTRRPVQERVKDSHEFYLEWSEQDARDQSARCMSCAVPFCHTGCPLGNLIPEWNHLVYMGQWEQALKRLHATNNFPEFTGRICPAPCEPACVLTINEDPVTIEYIEKAIVDRGFQEAWIKPEPPASRTGKRVAVIGSGPAGLAAAQQLNRAGHLVTIFERDESIGGLLRLGIPDFKLEKHVVQRRIDLMAEEGIVFKTGVHAGHDLPVEELRRDFDAICMTIGACHARELPVAGRDLNGIHLAMEYLTQQNRRIAGHAINPSDIITAEGKRVVILGGGDTGADCLGTAHRQGAEVVYQLELLPQPPEKRRTDDLWPQWPLILRTSAAHEEGGIRDYNILTKSFSGRNGRVEELNAVHVEWGPPDGSGRPTMQEVPGSEYSIGVDLVLLAMGFVHPEQEGLVTDLGVELDSRGNIKTNGERLTSVHGVFAAGDSARGASLVVWAIAEGRQAAYGIDKYLMGNSSLPQVSV